MPEGMAESLRELQAEEYGSIVDIPFPVVNPKGDTEYIVQLANDCVEKIMRQQPRAVLCQGEFSLAFHVITELKKRNVKVLAACSERSVETNGNKKQVIFEFEQFREY